MSRRRRKKPGTKEHWSDSQRIEAITAYIACGSPSQVCTNLNIPLPTFNRWKAQKWFKDYMEQIRNQETLELDAKLSRIVKKSLEQLEDRVDNGNYQFNPRNGEIIRVPVTLKDLSGAADKLLERQAKIREKPEVQTEEQSMQSKLVKLAEEFAKFSKAKTIEGVVIHATEGEGLQRRVSEVPRDTGTEEEPGQA